MWGRHEARASRELRGSHRPFAPDVTAVGAFTHGRSLSGQLAEARGCRWSFREAVEITNLRSEEAWAGWGAAPRSLGRAGHAFPATALTKPGGCGGRGAAALPGAGPLTAPPTALLTQNLTERKTKDSEHPSPHPWDARSPGTTRVSHLSGSRTELPSANCTHTQHPRIVMVGAHGAGGGAQAQPSKLEMSARI